MANKIIIVNEQEKEPFLRETQNLIKFVIKEALFNMGILPDCEVSVTLTDDEKIRVINREHRNIDSATDVLSFPQYTQNELDEFTVKDEIVLGDIVISAQRARAQASEYGHSYTREIAFLVVHSLLHLIGYDHMSEKEEKEMFTLQERILEGMGIVRK